MGATRRAIRMALRALATAAVLWALALALLFFAQDILIFPGAVIPKSRLIVPLVPATRRLWREDDGARVEAWYRPPMDDPARKPRALIVFLHGNNEIIDPWEKILTPYVTQGYGVLLPEYRGFGRSTGWPDGDTVLGDVEALLAQALEPWADAPPPLVFHGRSLGGGLAVRLASRRMPAALILQQTFASLGSVAWRSFLIPPFLIRGDWDTAAALPRLGLPTLLIHGRLDRLIPFAHVEALKAAWPRAHLLAGPWLHQDVPDDRAYWDAVLAFVAEAVPDAPNREP